MIIGRKDLKVGQRVFVDEFDEEGGKIVQLYAIQAMGSPRKILMAKVKTRDGVGDYLTTSLATPIFKTKRKRR